MDKASKFVLNRKRLMAENRIINILWYVVECYSILVKDKVQYSKDYVRNHTTHAFEDYLKFRLIEDYLIKNKHLLKNKMSALDKIGFLAETQKEYIDSNDNKQKPDKIDIYINQLGLKNVWKENDENIYFAIECKRIKTLSDTTDYIKDIEKFVNRNYMSVRLSFEGQIAFIETASITHFNVSDSINRKLSKKATITTDSSLVQCRLNPNYEGTYASKHRRNTEKQDPFSIYHLLFDYSKIVID
ncbi:hypothetical protein EZS27_011832 [termite gut metagenome]|uniref:Uncharacterized protein n=1 Tax=termite gut metagenome TaxID=433724 RepID=A0A5J4S266_9ZZZZ